METAARVRTARACCIRTGCAAGSLRGAAAGLFDAGARLLQLAAGAGSGNGL